MRIPLVVKLVITAFAPVFLTLWIIAESGRWLFDLLPSAVLVSAAIAVVPWRPRIAIGIMAISPLCALLGPAFAPIANSWWAVSLGLLIPIAVAAATLGGRWRWAVLVVVGWTVLVQAVLAVMMPNWLMTVLFPYE